MKIIRIGNDIQITWIITRLSQPEDFYGKDVSVSLIDKHGNKQIFNYQIVDNIISGKFYGKDQSTNGTYRLLLIENEGKVDMVTLDYIDCFCLSNKLKNQTSNGVDSTSSINTEVVDITSDINLGGSSPIPVDVSNFATKEYVNDAIDIVAASIPTALSELTNDCSFLTEHQDISSKVDASVLATVAFSGSYEDLTNKPSLFSGSYEDLTNKPTIPTKTSQLTNDSSFLTEHQDISGKQDVILDLSDIRSGAALGATAVQDSSYNHTDNNFTDNLKNKLESLTPSEFTQVQADWSQIDTSAVDFIKNKPDLFSGSYDDLSNKPTIPTKISDLTNDSSFITEHQDISGKANTADLSTVAFSGSYNDLTNKPTLFSGNYVDLTNKPSIPTKTSDLTNDSSFVTLTVVNDISTHISEVERATAAALNELYDKIDTSSGGGSVAQVQSDWSQIDSTAVDFIKNKPTLFSGSYNDLSNKPTIPTQTSQLTNNSNFVSSLAITQIVKLTETEYNNLQTKDASTLYIIQ